jgi:hypothetical protein
MDKLAIDELLVGEFFGFESDNARGKILFFISGILGVRIILGNKILGKNGGLCLSTPVGLLRGSIVCVSGNSGGRTA